jgi:hypothetical protein
MRASRVAVEWAMESCALSGLGALSVYGERREPIMIAAQTALAVTGLDRSSWFAGGP